MVLGFPAPLTTPLTTAQAPYTDHNEEQPLVRPYTDEEPGASPQMEVALGGARNFKGLPTDPMTGEREWSNGTLSCLADPLTFVAAWFTPCFVYGRNRARVRTLETTGQVNMHPLDGVVSGDSALHVLGSIFGCAPCVVMRGRAHTRRRYGIAGNGCGDCCVACCCHPCALTQESLEIELEEQSIGDGHAGSWGAMVAGKR
ncbi:PLAC8-domain-containing protein [Mycena kentingensis (nom. inval.)]|nr:PLAC8-domain-containing protein [Mycena kentingensis (nom. inval.)]